MLEAIEADRGPLAARRGVGGAAARLGAPLRARDRALRRRQVAARRATCSASTRSAACSSRTASTRARSTPRQVDRRAHWRRHLVDEPRGLGARRARRLGRLHARPTWRPSRRDGTPVLLYVGRFTEVKRAAAADRGLRAAPGALRAPRAAGAARRLPGRVGGRAPARGDRAHAARRTSSSPAGTATTSCPPSSRPPTSSCSPPCASSSARCSSRGWRAACRRSPSTPAGRRRSSPHGETAGWCEPDDGDALADALVARRPPGRAPPPRRRARRAVARARYAWPALAARVAARLRRRRARQRRATSCVDGASHALSAENRRTGSPLGPCPRRRRVATFPALAVPKSRPSGASVAATPAADRAGRPYYDPQYEHDACGVAFVARLSGEPEPRDGPAARSSRSRTSSTAARPAPTRTPATARACCCRCPTSSCAGVIGAELPPAGAVRRRASASCRQDEERRAELERLLDRGGRGRGPARRRLARHPGREGLRRHHRQLLRALHQAARGRRRRPSSPPTRTRSSASST